MSVIAAVSGIKTAIKMGEEVVDATKKVVRVGRKAIAQEELKREKDLDGDGVVGGVGNVSGMQRDVDCKAGAKGG